MPNLSIWRRALVHLLIVAVTSILDTPWKMVHVQEAIELFEHIRMHDNGEMNKVEDELTCIFEDCARQMVPIVQREEAWMEATGQAPWLCQNLHSDEFTFKTESDTCWMESTLAQVVRDTAQVALNNNNFIDPALMTSMQQSSASP